MADLDKIKDELNKLTILEVAELVKTLEEEWGVSAAAPVAAIAAAGGGDGGGEAAEEKTEFDIVLDGFGDNKIAVIKEVRGAVPGLGLADAKKMVEAPSTLREGVAKEEAEEIKKKLEEAGAKITLK